MDDDQISAVCRLTPEAWCCDESSSTRGCPRCRRLNDAIRWRVGAHRQRPDGGAPARRDVVDVRQYCVKMRMRSSAASASSWWTSESSCQSFDGIWRHHSTLGSAIPAGASAGSAAPQRSRRKTETVPAPPVSGVEVRRGERGSGAGAEEGGGAPARGRGGNEGGGPAAVRLRQEAQRR